MRAVVQRVGRAAVTVGGKCEGSIESGLLVYLGVGVDDETRDAARLAGKIADLRIFVDQEYKMNRSVKDEGGAILVVSQFTLYADSSKGRRPSYDRAAPPDAARILYEEFIRNLRLTGLRIETGVYQAVMEVSSVNLGPVTILLDTEELSR